jgi:H3 lysine-79-specific histone-lysine N-methyltransferase
VNKELEIKKDNDEKKYDLKILMELYREKLLKMVEIMKSNNYRDELKMKIESEKERKKKMKSSEDKMEKKIKVIIDDSVEIMKERMYEIGINDS